MAKTHPDWVQRHKRKGAEIRQIGANYYMYERTSRWDPETKKSKKVTGKYLGRVTEQGIIPPKHERSLSINTILEHGNIQILHYFAQPIEKHLREHFPEEADTLLAMAAIRCAYQAPLKNLQFHHKTSTTHQYWPNSHLSSEATTRLLKQVGMEWSSQLDVFQSLGQDSDHAAIDITQILSKSENIHWLEKGYNAHGIRANQLQILLIHSLGKSPHPTFLKLLPGSIHDVKTLAYAVWEAGLKRVVLVSDKGFFSKRNLDALEGRDLNYLIALKRSHPSLKYGGEDKYNEYFEYQGRFIWAREYKWGKRRILHCLDKGLRVEEEKTFLRKVEEGTWTKAKFDSNRAKFGTLALVTNTKIPLTEANALYKQRVEVELAFDALKNQLEADKSYMRSRESIAGYYFIVFLALYLYSGILNHLREKGLVSKYSVRDVLLHTSKIYKTFVGDEERISEIPKKAATILKKLDIPMT